jgi:hypothetical protein
MNSAPAAALASSASSASSQASSIDWDAVVRYIFWAITNLGVPVGLPILVLLLLDAASQSSNGNKLIEYATKDGQLLWSAMAVAAAALYEISESHNLHSMVKLGAQIVLSLVVFVSLVWVVWWTVGNHAKAAGGGQVQALTPKEAVLITGSKALIFVAVVIFAFAKPYL